MEPHLDVAFREFRDRGALADGAVLVVKQRYQRPFLGIEPFDGAVQRVEALLLFGPLFQPVGLAVGRPPPPFVDAVNASDACAARATRPCCRRCGRATSRNCSARRTGPDWRRPSEKCPASALRRLRASGDPCGQRVNRSSVAIDQAGAETGLSARDSSDQFLFFRLHGYSVRRAAAEKVTREPCFSVVCNLFAHSASNQGRDRKKRIGNLLILQIMNFIMVPLVTGIVTLGIYKFFELLICRRERREIIGKLEPGSLIDYLKLVPMGLRTGATIRTASETAPGIPAGALKAGCLLLGLGAGLLFGFMLTRITEIQSYDTRLRRLRRFGARFRRPGADRLVHRGARSLPQEVGRAGPLWKRASRRDAL